MDDDREGGFPYRKVITRSMGMTNVGGWAVDRDKTTVYHVSGSFSPGSMGIGHLP